jgi:transcriptional regulator with XRE-family HTH domain
MGAAIASAQAEHGLTRSQVARRAGVSSDTIRRIVTGEPGVQVDTLCAVGSAVGLDIVLQAFPSRKPSLRDSGQLDLAEFLCGISSNGWRSSLEFSAGDHGEAIDVCFFGPNEILAVEIDRMILDFQDQYRRNVRKREFLAGHHRRPVRLVMAIEDTQRNRSATAAHLGFLRSHLPAGSREITTALRSGEPLGRDGLLWIRRSRIKRPR